MPAFSVRRLYLLGLLLFGGGAGALLHPQTCAGQDSQQPASSSGRSSSSSSSAGSVCERARAAPPLAVRRADACVRRVFSGRRQAEYREAARAYRSLLRQADVLVGAGPEEARVVERHLRQLALILPERLRREVRKRISEGASQGNGKLAPALLEWWRLQDPLPATAENERLYEHLERVAFAEKTYGGEENAMGFDERGEVYVRLGPPGRTMSVSFGGSRILTDVVRKDRTLMRSDFPENEYWTYPRLGSRANYLFIEGSHGYHLGYTQELVPGTLRRGMSNTPRGRGKAERLRIVLEEVYSQLGTLNVGLGSWYQDLVALRPSMGGAANTVNLRAMLSKERAEEEKNTQKRLRAVPQQSTNVSADVSSFDIAARTARFLTPDGATRAEVYWSVPLAQLKAQRKDGGRPPAYLLTGTMSRRALRDPQRAARQRRHLVTLASNRFGAVLAPQTYVARATADTFHVSVQWDEYVATRDPQTQRLTRPGAHLRRAVYRRDSLAALRESGGLEMSGLKPLFVSEEELAQGMPALKEAPPYPFKSVAPGASLGLYFEAYHLGMGKDDRTHYTVEYAIVRSDEPGGLGGLFRRAEQRRTVTKTTNAGRRRTAREYIVLDLDEWEAEGQVKILVRITDEVTGRRESRSIQFDVKSTDTATPE